MSNKKVSVRPKKYKKNVPRYKDNKIKYSLIPVLSDTLFDLQELKIKVARDIGLTSAPTNDIMVKALVKVAKNDIKKLEKNVLEIVESQDNND